MEKLPEFYRETPLPPSARKVSTRFLKALAAMEDEVENLISTADEDVEFLIWQVMEDIAALFIDGHPNPLEEIVRRSTTGTHNLSYPLLLSLMRFYRIVKKDFATELEGIKTRRGEAERARLFDALPLLGEDAWLDFMDVKNHGLAHYERKWKRKAGQKLAEIVFRGDNHIEDRLLKALITFLPVASGGAKK